MAIPIVLSNPLDSSASKKCTQNQNKVTLQSLKNFMDKPAASALKNTSIHSLIVNNMANQAKPNALTSPKIVLPGANKSSTSGQATTIAQICANLNNNQYKIQTNNASQQLISHMIPGPIRFLTNPTLVNSTITSTPNASSNSNSNNSTQSPNSSPLKPNIIRKAR